MYQYKRLTSTSRMSPITNLQKKVLFINISTALKVMFGDFGKSYVYFLYKLCLTLCREQDPVVHNSPMLGAQHLFHSQLRWFLLLVFCFVVVVLSLSFRFCSSHRSSRHLIRPSKDMPNIAIQRKMQLQTN